jgi:TolB protein
MIRAARVICLIGGSLALVARVVPAQNDTTFKGGVSIVVNFDPLRTKIPVVVLPVSGAFGDSVRAIVQRDLDYSDRFVVIAIDSADPATLRAQGVAAGLNYDVFRHLNAAAVVQMTMAGNGVHVALHNVNQKQVMNVGDFDLPGSGLGRDWRLGVHRASDEIERWMTGQRGIAATRIAYMRGRNIRIVDSDGADEITVPTDSNGTSPAWNPAGTTLAYSTYGDGSRLVVIDLATGRSRTLAGPTRNVIYTTPVFSPDGNSVAFTRTGEAQGDIYVVPADGASAPNRLTVAHGAQNSNPVYSPKGQRIVYVSNSQGPPELYIMDSDGTGADQLTRYDFDPNNYRSDPDWSPDGRLIAYQEMLSGRFQIRTIPANGGTPKQLTNDGQNEQPSWAPDSRHIVFTSTRTGVRQLWVLDTESFRTRQLTKAEGSRLAAWSARLSGQ